MAQIISAPAWAFDQLAKLHRQRPELVDGVLAQLLADNPELLWSLVLNAYLDEEINLGKAAELMGMHELELRERFIELGIPLRVGPTDLAEAQAEVNAIGAWFGNERDDSSES